MFNFFYFIEDLNVFIKVIHLKNILLLFTLRVKIFTQIILFAIITLGNRTKCFICLGKDH